MHMCNALYIPHRDRSVLNRYQTCRHMCLCTRPVCIERDLGKAHLHVYICSYVHMYPLTEEETYIPTHGGGHLYTHLRRRTLIYPFTEEETYIPTHGGYTHSRRRLWGFKYLGLQICAVFLHTLWVTGTPFTHVKTCFKFWELPRQRVGRRSQDQKCWKEKSLDSPNMLRIRILRNFFKLKPVI